jgi:hypothetical protein
MPKTLRRPSQPAIYPERESKTLELKLRLPDFRTLAKTCIAFANCSGGDIVIGVEDRTRNFVGVAYVERDRLYDEFPSSLYDLVNPVLVPHIYEKNVDGWCLMIVRIWPGDSVPYFVKSLGIPAGVFIRIGSSSRPANEQTIELKGPGCFISFPVMAISTPVNSRTLRAKAWQQCRTVKCIIGRAFVRCSTRYNAIPDTMDKL